MQCVNHMRDITSNASTRCLDEKYAAGFRHLCHHCSHIHAYSHSHTLALTLNEALLLLYCNKAFYKQTNKQTKTHLTAALPALQHFEQPKPIL